MYAERLNGWQPVRMDNAVFPLRRPTHHRMIGQHVSSDDIGRQWRGRIVADEEKLQGLQSKVL